MSERANKAVIIWLFTVAALVGLMVVVGGYVRLTRAGLSIVEWNPISGVVPPIGEQAWQQEFAKYQQTPEFKIVNAAMTLEEYKGIFYLEWAHRLIARLAGLIVVLPLIYFLWKGIIPWRRSALYLLIAFLFAFQGFMGWYMVSSGLIDQPHVSHFRLTIHLLIALTLLALALWMGLDRVYGHGGATRPRWSGLGLAALAIIVVQIAYGGLVAGLKAGHVSNTWPLMGGALVPSGLFPQTGSWLESMLEGAADRTLHPPVAGLRGAGDCAVALLPPGRGQDRGSRADSEGRRGVGGHRPGPNRPRHQRRRVWRADLAGAAASDDRAADVCDRGIPQSPAGLGPRE